MQPQVLSPFRPCESTSAGAPMLGRAGVHLMVPLLSLVALLAGGTSGSVSDEELVPVYRVTTGAAGFAPAQMTAGRRLQRLRRLTGLNWDQLAYMFGVSRRTVHFWASGCSLTATHEELVGRISSVLEEADLGTAAANRAALFSHAGQGRTPFDLLIAGQLEEARLVLLSARQPLQRPQLGELSAEARARRLPTKPLWVASAEVEPDIKPQVTSRRVKRSRIRRGE